MCSYSTHGPEYRQGAGDAFNSLSTKAIVSLYGCDIMIIMVAMLQDRWFIWTVVSVVVIGIGTWAYIQYALIQMDIESLNFVVGVPSRQVAVAI